MVCKISWQGIYWKFFIWKKSFVTRALLSKRPVVECQGHGIFTTLKVPTKNTEVVRHGAINKKHGSVSTRRAFFMTRIKPMSLWTKIKGKGFELTCPNGFILLIELTRMIYMMKMMRKLRRDVGGFTYFHMGFIHRGRRKYFHVLRQKDYVAKGEEEVKKSSWQNEVAEEIS
ncbi:uncharacterized protein LOC132280048 isoform X2 [Cornus florida]|uniref:uncharacterized protein LOC132280048 isoform X2 n=1 Tax=Cornus florida TaxID=4283 RepID=UPI0028A1FE0C|nr:uncharacterized protein LOC132280048 isoform X2 [Cornus florida]